MKKSVRIFWRLFLFGFLAVVLLFTLINYGVFGKMPSLSELENPTIIQASEIFAEELCKVKGTLKKGFDF